MKIIEVWGYKIKLVETIWFSQGCNSLAMYMLCIF